VTILKEAKSIFPGRHCEERSDEAISVREASFIEKMGVYQVAKARLLRFARNDGLLHS
jgi:hypothetical protein